jgi:hypothetical protein
MILYAFIGEDEFGSGVVGLKMIRAASGDIVPAVVAEHHLDRLTARIGMMQAQADQYGKTIRLVKFESVEEITVIAPGSSGGSGNGSN